MQIFANGERGFDSFREFYAIHLKNIGVRARGGSRGAAAPPPLQKFLKLFVQDTDDSGKSTCEKTP